MSEAERGREAAYKGVVVVSLTVTLVSMSFIVTVLPILSELTLGTNGILENDAAYCEVTANDLSVLLTMASTHQFNLTSDKQKRGADSEDLTEARECKCEFPSGPRGLPGRDGLPGLMGSEGAPGLPARLPCESPTDYSKACPDPCPSGIQGPPGPPGVPGDKGVVGLPGAPGIRGMDGKLGAKGEVGPRGIPGLDGEVGDSGEDSVPQPFIPGPPGEVGDEGPPGPAGPPGMPGIDGPIGPAGPRGIKGKDGLPGGKGDPGMEGPLGESGKQGVDGVCPTYCATDGGVFFLQPPDWFFDN